MKIIEMPDSTQVEVANALAAALREAGVFNDNNGMVKAREIAETIREAYVTLYSGQNISTKAETS